ncbi:MAG: TonB-dependent receptor [Chloracidobacterium sp.]|nr:TonB-dependent receptor [Chloracidobacterium sp.]
MNTIFVFSVGILLGSAVCFSQSTDKNSGSMRLTGGFWDKTGAVVSWACAIHCLAMPFLISFLPLIGLSFLADEGFGFVFLGLSVLVAAVSLLPGYFKQHGKIRTLLLFINGIGLLFFADILFPENIIGETVFVLFGAGLITASHILNRRLCRECEQCDETDPKSANHPTFSNNLLLQDAVITDPSTINSLSARIKTTMNNLLKPLLIVIFCAVTSLAQSNGTIRGGVTSQVNNAPLANVTVQITQLGRSVETNENGVYEFANVMPGRYTLVTHTDGFSDQAQSVVVASGATSNIDFALSLTALREEVTVTATGSEESVFESFQSVNAVGATRIREQASTSIGEVLERESGVGKRAFGPGAARPVIRGFDGDRVLVVQDGIRTGSLASQSGDHGEPIDSLNLERIEILKGPATLLYGSNAIGGVINAVSSDENQAHEGFRGNFTGLGATNNKQGGASGGVEYGFGKSLFNANANYIREGDYKTPFGEIPNSAARSFGGHGSFGHYADKWFMAGSFNLDRRRYGIPYAPLFEEGVLLTDDDGNPCEPGKKALRGKGGECQYDIFAIRDRFSRQLPEVPDEAIDIKMRSNNFRVRGGFRDVGGAIPQGNFSINYTRYRHDEIETADAVDTVATSFTNNTFSYRGVFQQAKSGPLSGQFGFEGYARDYLTVGAEQLIDGKVKQNNFAFFGLEELSFGRVALQFGGRVESNRFRPANTTLYIERDFTGFSGAAAARIGLWEGGSFVANFTSAYRSPSIEELYNEGAHIGTVTFEIGDQNLVRERSNGIELSLRHRAKRVRFSGSFFYYKIDNFVFIAPQDEDGNGNVDVEDNLPIGAYRQNDARFMGADFTFDADIKKWLGTFFIADAVNAELRGTSSTPLPRITPARIRAGLDLRYKGLSVRPEGVFVGARKIDDVFILETPTAGYGLFNVNASYTVASDRMAHIFSLGTSNLGNRLYRNHLSFIKDLAPEPGRGLRLSYTMRFF